MRERGLKRDVMVASLLYPSVAPRTGARIESPISTMETLHQIPHAWSQVLPASKWFELVIGGKAVLNKETGFVSEKSLDFSKVSTCKRKQSSLVIKFKL